jgi:hypothetical protein
MQLAIPEKKVFNSLFFTFDKPISKIKELVASFIGGAVLYK